MQYVINDCLDNDYHDFYDVGCSATSYGVPRCDFVSTAYQNHVDYNDPPSASLLTQTSYQWYNANGFSMHGSFTDPEGCYTGAMNFSITHDSICDDWDPDAPSDTSSPFTSTYYPTSSDDDAFVWSCTRGFDGMETGPWVMSASSFGIDVTPPAPSVTVPSGVQTLAYTVNYGAYDSLSGVGNIRLEESTNCLTTGPCPIQTSFTQVCSTSGGGWTSHYTSCSRNPTVPAKYCYRTVAYDIAGNVATSSSTSCVTKA